MTRWQHQGPFRAAVGTVQRGRVHGDLWLLGALSQEALSVQAEGWARGPSSQEAEERVREGRGWGRRTPPRPPLPGRRCPVQGAALGLSVPTQGCWGICSAAWGRLSENKGHPPWGAELCLAAARDSLHRAVGPDLRSLKTNLRDQRPSHSPEPWVDVH